MRSDTRERLEEILRHILDVETLPPGEASLRQRGLDSLALFTLIERMEESFGVKIQEDELLPRNFDTIDGLLMFLDSKLPPDDGSR